MGVRMDQSHPVKGLKPIQGDIGRAREIIREVINEQGKDSTPESTRKLEKALELLDEAETNLVDERTWFTSMLSRLYSAMIDISRILSNLTDDL